MDYGVSGVIAEKPYPAFQVGGYVYRETAYGIIKRLRFFLDHLEVEREKRNLERSQMHLLDIGCGTGISVTVPLGGMGYSVLGLDTDQASIERGRELTKGLPGADFRCGPLEELLPVAKFHAVICSEVLEHLAEPQHLLRQIHEVLLDGGLLLVTVPNGYGYFELESLFYPRFSKLHWAADGIQHRIVRKLASEEPKRRHMVERSPDYIRMARTSLAPDQTHIQRFTAGRFRHLLVAQGFEIIEFRNRTFLAGNILQDIVRDSDVLLDWNGVVADHLPHFLCSGWMAAARTCRHSR